MTLNEVLKNTNYDVSLFSEEARKYVEDAIVVKTIRGKESLFIKSFKTVQQKKLELAQVPLRKLAKDLTLK